MYTRFLLFLIFMGSSCLIEAQVINRSPYVQRPSQHSVTIAWRRANISTGRLFIGTSPGVWTDTLYSPSPTQKHFFDLTGLAPNTQYFYQAYSVAPGDTFLSGIEPFYTAKEDTSGKLSFLVYGDCGYNNTPQHQVKALMETETVDFCVVTGDVDQGTGNNYDAVFFGVYKNMMKNECHFTCIGNHDTYADNAATYLDEFYLFHNNPTSTERYYSYTWGDAKFICLDANLPYTVGTPQYNWMIDELKCNDKKWLFVYCHQPPWSNAWSADYYVPFSPYFLYQGDEDMRTDLVPRWEEYGVDFVLNGHSHCYQRGNYNGVQYLISGGGGASSLDFHTNSNAPNLSVEIYENHYVKFLVSGDTAKYYMIDKNGVYRDSVQVIKASPVHYAGVLTTTNETCYNMDDGTAAYTVSGPYPPYNLAWSTGQITPSILYLDPGNYSLDISDSRGCTRTENFTIEDHPAINAHIMATGFGFHFCEGDSLELLATPGYTSYAWSDGSITANTFVHAAGNYSVIITDAAGCTASATQPVTMGPLPVSSFTINDHQNLIIDFAAVPCAGCTYQWDFGDSFTETGTNTNTGHFYLAAGTYTIRLITTNACGSDTLEQTVTIAYTVSVEENPEADVHITPNPFSTQTVLSFSNSAQEAFSLALFDLQGKLIRTYNKTTGNQFIIEKAGLSAGVYVYQLTHARKAYRGKIVVE